MSSFYKELSSQIIHNENYTDACDDLFEAYISKIANVEYKVDEFAIKKLATTIQYFYRSEFDKYLKEGSILLSMMLYVSGSHLKPLIAIADNVYSHSGDFPNVNLLEKKFPEFKFKESFFNETIKELREELNTVDGIDHPLTDYQRSLWEDLISDEDVITSAPTSTGKTHIILQYLMQVLLKSDGAFVAIVVPTRALISELAGKIYEIAKSSLNEDEIEICTVPKDGEFKDKTFFVMTQERLFEVLQRGDLNFDYLFVDEAHNISDQSRGVLLHLTLQKLLEGSLPQIIVSMPSPLYQNAFDSVFEGIEFIKQATSNSPVAKLIISVLLKGRDIQLSRLNSENIITIKKEFKGTKLADIVYRLGQGESNIVYRNQTNYCEDTAQNIAELITENKNREALEEAADYVESFLHHDFTLASNLRKGVAFHYGPLPGVIRTMIEDLAREGEVQFVVCTSTLAEGINLPAKNLFLTNPTQVTGRGETNLRLENVKLDNITGRAGRMLEHFAGNVFLINHDDWKYKDYFEEREEEVDKIPTYFKLLNENSNKVFEALKGEYSHQEDDQYTYYTIANKLIKEFTGETLSSTLNAKELILDEELLQLLESNVEVAFRGLNVDTFTLEANPSIGFIQQNKLHSFFLEQDDLTDWVLPHPKSPLLFERLEAICQILYDTGIFLPNDNVTVSYACLIAKKWMVGDSLKSIISKQIERDFDFYGTNNCNSSVRKVIKVINNDIRFRMSSALRCYHSLITDVIGTRNLDIQSVKLYSFIEVGGCDDRMVNLVGFGLSRETSLEIDRILPENINIDSVSALRRLNNNGSFDRLHVITQREIKSLSV